MQLNGRLQFDKWSMRHTFQELYEESSERFFLQLLLGLFGRCHRVKTGPRSKGQAKEKETLQGGRTRRGVQGHEIFRELQISGCS